MSDSAGLMVAPVSSWASQGHRLRGKLSHGVQGGAVYALGDQLVFSFGNMVVAALVSRHGSLVQFGIYILTQRAMDVLIQLSNGFLWTPLTFALPGLAADRKAEYRGSIVFLQVCLCVAFSGLMGLAWRSTASPAHAALHATFGALVLTGGGILFREFTRRLYFAELRLKEAFWTDAATVFLQITGAAWLSLMGWLTVPRTLAVLCFGSLAVSLWWVLQDWGTWRLNCRVVATDLKGDFQLGRWLFAGNMVAVASAQCNPWVLNAMLGSAYVGTYSVCESLVNITRAALTSMQNVMGPTVARAFHESGKDGIRAAVSQLDRILLMSSCVFAALLFLSAPWLAHLIYRSAPDGTRLMTSVLAVNLVAFACTLAQSYGLTALGRPDCTLYANLAGLTVQACFCVCLIRSLAVQGAACALLAGSVAVWGARQWFYTRETGPAARFKDSAPQATAA